MSLSELFPRLWAETEKTGRQRGAEKKRGVQRGSGAFFEGGDGAFFEGGEVDPGVCDAEASGEDALGILEFAVAVGLSAAAGAVCESLRANLRADVIGLREPAQGAVVTGGEELLREAAFPCRELVGVGEERAGEVSAETFHPGHRTDPGGQGELFGGTVGFEEFSEEVELVGVGRHVEAVVVFAVGGPPVLEGLEFAERLANFLEDGLEERDIGDAGDLHGAEAEEPGPGGVNLDAA